MLTLLVASVAPAAGQEAVVVDHTNLSLYDRIPPRFVQAASELRLVFVNLSVGQNISEGLDCIAGKTRRRGCQRIADPPFAVPQREVEWGANRPRDNWVFRSWPRRGAENAVSCDIRDASSWRRQIQCFTNFVSASSGRIDVAAFQHSYALVTENSPPLVESLTSPDGVAQIERLQREHPDTTIVWQTTSLARGIGTQNASDFNDGLRGYVQDTGGYLLDVAAIISHDPDGNPCYDNRDGVPYRWARRQENHPDDGRSLPAICAHYTSEVDGGHLGRHTAGKIRAAKGWWIMMARIAGWRP